MWPPVRAPAPPAQNRKNSAREYLVSSIQLLVSLHQKRKKLTVCSLRLDSTADFASEIYLANSHFLSADPYELREGGGTHRLS